MVREIHTEIFKFELAVDLIDFKLVMAVYLIDS